MLSKVGIKLQILKAGSLADVLPRNKQVSPKEASQPKNSEFIYFAAKAIRANDPNGNGDFFPWAQLLESYSSFNGRSLFLNHNSDDPRNAIGKVLDAYPVEDPKTGEKYIECLAKIDAVAHPELARQLSTGILDAVSMGCSVEESMCSICGVIIHSDHDDKCQHMSKGLLKEYIAEVDIPDFNIKKGQKTQAFAINKGINFTELSVVNVPAWNNAKIVQVISNLTDQIKKEANTKQEGDPSVLIRTLEDLITMAKKANAEAPVEPKKEAEESTEEKVETKAEEKTEEKVETKAEETTEEKVEVAAEVETPASAVDTLKELLGKKLSALEYIELQNHFTEKTEEPKKETEVAAETKEAEVAIEAGPLEALDTAIKNQDDEQVQKLMTSMPEDMKGKAAPKAQAFWASRKEEKKEMEHEKGTLPGMSSLKKWMELLSKKKVSEKVATKFESVWKKAAEEGLTDAEAAKSAIESLPEEFFSAAPESKEAEANYKAIFVSKPSIKESYWIVTNNGQPVLKATLDQAWGNKLSEVVDYATSTEYGDTLLRRLKADGVKKVASLTNATIYEKEAADQRGQIGKGTAWPGQKGIGKSQYKPSQYGGPATPASKGPSAGSGDQAASSKSVGKSQYKPSQYGGKATPASAGPAAQKGKVKGSEEEKITKKADDMMKAPAEMPAEMPTEMPAAETEMPAEEEMCQMADDAARIEHMEKMLAEMEAAEDLKKPIEAVRKSIEKLTDAKTKADEKAAKEEEKEAAKAAKEQEKADKEAEKERVKAEKEAEKERAKAEKESEKEEKVETESKTEVPVETESKEIPAETVEAKTEEKKKEVEAETEEKKEVEATEETKEKVETEAKTDEEKKEVEAKEETEKVETEAKEKDEKKEKESSEEATEKVEVEAEVQPSAREIELERELARVKAEQSLKEKTIRARAIANEMLDKELITPDEQEVQAAVAGGGRLFDARANALKTAIDRQITDLLKMDSTTLKAFANSIKRVKKTASQGPGNGALKKRLNLRYSESTTEDKWLGDVFGQMGSQKDKF